MNAKYPSLLSNHTVILLRLTKSDYAENIYVLNYETVHMSTFRNFLLKLQNPMLFPGYTKTTKSYSKAK